MKALLLKYKWRFLFWLVFLAVVLYFAPRQSDFYLDSDIKHFKKEYLIPTLTWTGVVLSTALLVFVFAKIKSLKQSAFPSLAGVVMIAFILFIFQDLFLAAALFINRLFKRDILQKTYVVNYMAGAEQTRDNFIPYDLAGKQVSTDQKIVKKIYQSGLKQYDTITLKFDKGLLGIAYLSQSFDSQ